MEPVIREFKFSYHYYLKLAAALTFCLWLCLEGTAGAVSSGGPLKVYVDCSANDSVGQRVCFALKEKIRASKGFRLVDSPGPLTFEIHLASIDDATPDENRGLSSAIAAAFTIMPADNSAELYLNVEVTSLGTNRVQEQAEQYLSNLDKDAQPFRSLINKR